MVSCTCICCGNGFATESSDNPIDIFSVYGGLIFRSTGNYGSHVFDPMPTQKEEMLQVIICDECIRKNASRVKRIHNIKRKVTAKIEKFKP